jgi:hypothetical protein
MRSIILFALLIFYNLVFAQTMVIQTVGGVLEFELSEIANISFSEDTFSEEMEIVISNIPFSFLQNSPNPFNPSTKISFDIKSDNTGNTELTIYNLKGQKVKQLVNESLAVGQHSYIWNGKDENNKKVSTGVYFYKLQIDGKHKVKKMLMLK